LTTRISLFLSDVKETGMVEFIKKLLTKWGRVTIIIIFLAGIILLTSQLTLPDASVPLSNLQPLNLNGYHRLLILAPHCDDETLGSAGLILAAERDGIQVRVVIATNGDGFLFAAIRDFRKLYPRPVDFVRMGEIRQLESLKALSILGVQAAQVDFLSYPDRGTPALWNDRWAISNPYRSPFSGDIKSPYPNTYNPQSVYAGADYLADIISILNSYRPDLIVYPHSQDVHPDHWGLNVFTRLAITLIRHNNPTYQPTELTYLVHRPDFPEIRGLKPQAPLTPPAILYALSPDWFRLDLTPADITLKGQAVLAYRSQLPLLRNLLESFVRVNETFAAVHYATLPTIARGDPSNPSTWVDPSGQVVQPVQLDPVGDFATRSFVPAGDLTAVYAAKDAEGNLQVCAQLRENTIPEITYFLRLKALTDNGIISFQARTGRTSKGWYPAHGSGVYACVTVPLTALGKPWAIFVGATTVGGGRIEDESGWQMVYINRP
jgi:N-acetyl-1-D-myo-inositol-2-amino-2-deoxy-alpha-D-glucopyranoside deacetylase